MDRRLFEMGVLYFVYANEYWYRHSQDVQHQTAIQTQRQGLFRMMRDMPPLLDFYRSNKVPGRVYPLSALRKLLY